MSNGLDDTPPSGRFLLARDRVVNAGAGTGKTHALLTQYLHLLSGLSAHGRPIEPRALGVLTFTDKAAGELRERLQQRTGRIVQRLSEADGAEPEVLGERPGAASGGATADPAQRLMPVEPDLCASAAALGKEVPGLRFWLRVREQLGGAPIGTFHSFAASLLRRYAALAGLDPDFTLLDEDSARALLVESSERVVLGALEERLPPAAGAPDGSAGPTAEQAALVVSEYGFSGGPSAEGGTVEALCRLHRLRGEEGRDAAGLADSYRPDGLAAEFGLSAQGYRLSDAQAQAILELRLQRLTGLEQDKIIGEYKEVMAQIADLLDILAKPQRVTAIITGELTALKQEFGQTKVGARRSVIEHNVQELGTEDLITPTDMVVTLSHTGYIKSQPLAEYRAQKRGGRGKQATQTKEDDWIDQLFIANTHDWILCFSNRGRVYWLKVWEVPQGSRNSRGKPIVNMFPLQPDEKINVVLPLTGQFRSFPSDHFIFMATALGTVKKTALDEFSNPRKAGIIAVDLDAGDHLIGAALTDGKHDVMLFSDGGKAVRFDEDDVRAMGRAARGVRGMMLDEGQSVIAMLVAEDETQSVLTATENGFGKRTSIVEYTRHGRGTKGMIAIQQSERNGKVVAATLVRAADEIMLITDRGVLVRTRVSEIRELGRATQGVTLIALDDGAKLSGLQRIVENDANATDTEAPADEPTDGTHGGDSTTE